MKNKRLAVVLVLFGVLSYTVFSDQQDCEATQEYSTGNKHGYANIGCTPTLFIIGLPILGMVTGWGVAKIAGIEGFSEIDQYATTGYFGGTIALSFAPFILFRQQPKNIPDNISEEQLDCYLRGYKDAVVRRQVNIAFWGMAGWVSLWVIYQLSPNAQFGGFWPW